jgi:hypothetical protein
MRPIKVGDKVCPATRRRAMKRIVFLLSALALFLLPFSACAPDSSPERDTADPARALEGLSKDGWTLYDKVLEFTPESLYEQINGRAELYLSYDVLGLSYAAFDHASDPGLSISLSVYDMGSPQMAFGIYSVERSPGEEKVDLGREAYRSNADLYVWHGRYYIRAISTDTGELSRQTNLEWVRQVVASLPDTGKTVWGPGLLPGADLIADSLRYFKIDAMGLDFMTDTLTAQYTSDDGPIGVFVSRNASPDAARVVMDRYGEYADRYGTDTEIVTIDDTAYLVCDMGGAFDVIAIKDSMVCGVTAVDDRERALQEAVGLRRALRNGNGG